MLVVAFFSFSLDRDENLRNKRNERRRRNREVTEKSKREMQSIMPNAFIHTNKSVFRTNTIATTTAAQEKEKEYKKQPKNLEDIDVCVCV